MAISGDLKVQVDIAQEERRKRNRVAVKTDGFRRNLALNAGERFFGRTLLRLWARRGASCEIFSALLWVDGRWTPFRPKGHISGGGYPSNTGWPGQIRCLVGAGYRLRRQHPSTATAPAPPPAASTPAPPPAAITPAPPPAAIITINSSISPNPPKDTDVDGVRKAEGG